MQVSTRTADYLVDVITLRSIVGPVLAPIFADVKVRKLPQCSCNACIKHLFWHTFEVCACNGCCVYQWRGRHALHSTLHFTCSLLSLDLELLTSNLNNLGLCAEPG